MPYRQNSEITMDWSGNGMESPARIVQRFSEYAANGDYGYEEIVPLDSKQQLGHVAHDPAIKAVHMDAYAAFPADVLPARRSKNPLNTVSRTRRFKLLSKSAVVKPAKAVASGAARLTAKSKSAVVKPAKAVASGAARLTAKSKSAVVKPAKAVASGAARLTAKSKSAVVKPAKAMSNAVNQASSAVTGKARSIRSFFSGLQFPCLSKPDCKA
eukprot:jgi/Picre1/31940/NNA_007288.t1